MIIYAVVQGYGSLMPQIRAVTLKKSHAFTMAAEYNKCKVVEIVMTEWTDMIIGDMENGIDLISGVNYWASL